MTSDDLMVGLNDKPRYQATPTPRSEVPAPVPTGPQPVRVVAFDMPFLELTSFLVKLALAAIPATIILMFVGAIIMGVLAGMRGH